MIEGILVGVLTAAIMIFINAMVRRVGVQTRADRTEQEVAELKRGQRVIFKSLLALLLATKDGKTNGECEDALKDLNKFLFDNIDGKKE